MAIGDSPYPYIRKVPNGKGNADVGEGENSFDIRRGLGLTIQ